MSKITIVAAICILTLGACASDETPNEPVDDAPVETIVSDGIDTEVEQSENLGFDEPDEG